MPPEVTFKEDTHQYFNAHGEEYQSISNYIAQFKNKFDSQKMSKQVADRRGVPQSEVLGEWEFKRDLSTDLGHVVHSAIESIFDGDFNWQLEFKMKENYLRTREINSWLSEVMNYLSTLDLIEIYPEQIVYNHDLKLAGQLDAPIRTSQGLFILDWKTNAKIDFEGFRGQKMLGKFSHLDDCSFSHYSIQLNAYADMLDGHGDKVQGLKLVHLEQGGTIRIYNVPRVNVLNIT